MLKPRGKLRPISEADKHIVKFTTLQNTIQITESYKAALENTITENTELVPVLFVHLVHNYYYFSGLRLASPFLSAHWSERELTLLEGSQVCVLGSETISDLVREKPEQTLGEIAENEKSQE